MQQTLTKVINHLLLLLDQILQNFILLMMLLVFMLVHHILLLISLLYLKLLICLWKLLVLVNDLVQFLFLLLNVRLDIRKLIVCVLLDDPLKFWKHLIWLHALHCWRLELLSQGDKFHVLLAVFINLAQKDLRLSIILLVINLQLLLSCLQLLSLFLA